MINYNDLAILYSIN